MNSDELKQQLQIFVVQRRQLVLAVLSGVAAIIIIVAAIYPLWQRIQTTRNDIASLEKKLKAGQQKMAILEQIDSNMEADFERVNFALPDYKQPFNNLLVMNYIASQSGILIDEYDLTPGVVSTDSAELEKKSTTTKTATFDFEVTISGSLEQIQQAFALIETSLPLTEINKFDLSQSKLDSGSDRYVATLSLRSPYFKLEAADVAKKTVNQLGTDESTILGIIRTFALPGKATQFNKQEYNNSNLFGK